MYEKYLGKKLLKESNGTIEENGFWIVDSNKWSIKNYTKEEALEASKTLKNCSGCVDCENCTDCIDCTNCEDCTHCVECSDCVECSNCEDDYDCRNCANSYNCNGCIMCNSCTNCEDCTDCEDCEECENCHESNTLKDCKNCHECEKCESLLDCTNCVSCYESNNLKGCYNCYECENIVSGSDLHGVLNDDELYEESEESDELLDTDFRFIEKIYEGPNNLLEIYVPSKKYICKIVEKDMRYWESEGKIEFKFVYNNNEYGFVYHNEDDIDKWCVFYKNNKKICTLEIYDEEEVKPNCYVMYFK